MIKGIKIAISSFIACTIILSSANVANASEAEFVNHPHSISNTQTLQEEELQRGLELIMEIPDDVLGEGNAATRLWMQEHDFNEQPMGRASVGGCVAAIAAVIASTAFPAAKILKIKNLIKSLGGVVEAVKIIAGASFSYEKLHALGGAASALAAELLGIDGIKKQCFA